MLKVGIGILMLYSKEFEIFFDDCSFFFVVRLLVNFCWDIIRVVVMNNFSYLFFELRYCK